MLKTGQLILYLNMFIILHGSKGSMTRYPRFFNLFSMAKFSHSPCRTFDRDGTCMTQMECEKQGGSGDGSCAQGLGICCLFVHGCGSRSSRNESYFLMSTTPNPPKTCTMTVCKSNQNICHIKIDFREFNIAGPNPENGNCLTDTFTATSPGNRGSPAICGFNKGHHVLLDASDLCNKVHFNFGQSDNVTERAFEMKVTQYDCGSVLGGYPSGCLQYHTGVSVSGTLSSWNYPDLSNNESLSLHLASQEYSICFRREVNHCKICFYPAAKQLTLSLATSDEECHGHNIWISNGYLISPQYHATSLVQKICGTALASEEMIESNHTISVCTTTTPFVLNVQSDDKLNAFQDNDAEPKVHGFSLAWKQIQDCV